MPVLMRLSSTSRTPCHALEEDYFEELQDDRQLRLTTAVIVTVTTFCVWSFLLTHPPLWGFEVASSGDQPAWMVALTSLLRNPVLPKAEIHSRLGRELHRLVSLRTLPCFLLAQPMRQFFDSFGLETQGNVPYEDILQVVVSLAPRNHLSQTGSRR
ncbi:hypothetical protein EV401DRAFT_1981935 [Pisolithus croceorrhizus]|nr:hypothetical protein EV401DRAFT_1981935 [Pisolithus croceorrhizus]